MIISAFGVFGGLMGGRGEGRVEACEGWCSAGRWFIIQKIIKVSQICSFLNLGHRLIRRALKILPTSKTSTPGGSNSSSKQALLPDPTLLAASRPETSTCTEASAQRAESCRTCWCAACTSRLCRGGPSPPSTQKLAVPAL